MFAKIRGGVLCIHFWANDVLTDFLYSWLVAAYADSSAPGYFEPVDALLLKHCSCTDVAIPLTMI
jgi:hypothetical protein